VGATSSRAHIELGPPGYEGARAAALARPAMRAATGGRNAKGAAKTETRRTERTRHQQSRSRDSVELELVPRPPVDWSDAT
jgi:hypothetical protein